MRLAAASAAYEITAIAPFPSSAWNRQPKFGQNTGRKRTRISLDRSGRPITIERPDNCSRTKDQRRTDLSFLQWTDAPVEGHAMGEGQITRFRVYAL